MGIAVELILHVGPSIGYASSFTQPLLKRKLEEGWSNTTAGLLYNAWTTALYNTGIEGSRKSFLIAIRDVVFPLIDEDGHYLLRVYYALEKLFERVDPFETELVGEGVLELPRLLARNEGTPEFNLLHRNVKAQLPAAFGFAKWVCKRMISKKLKKGFTTVEASVIYESLDWIVKMDRNIRGKGGTDFILAICETARDAAPCAIDDDKEIHKFAVEFIKQIMLRKTALKKEMDHPGVRKYWGDWPENYRMIQRDEWLIEKGLVPKIDKDAIRQDPERYQRDAQEELNRILDERDRMLNGSKEKADKDSDDPAKD